MLISSVFSAKGEGRQHVDFLHVPNVPIRYASIRLTLSKTLEKPCLFPIHTCLLFELKV